MNKQHALVATFGRLLIAAIFLLSGFGKIANPEMTQGYIASAGLPFPLLAYLVAVAVEVGGGALLVVGFQTRIVGIVLAIFTVAAALSFHHNFADQTRWSSSQEHRDYWWAVASRRVRSGKVQLRRPPHKLTWRFPGELDSDFRLNEGTGVARVDVVI